MKGRHHVLVVDIDHDFLITTEGLLEALGFDTTITRDASEALGMPASRPF